MASPQVEDGHTKLSNELLEALARAPLNGAQMRLMLALVRLTYGWHRTSVIVSYGDLAKATGLHRQTVAAEMDTLAVMQYVVGTSRGPRRAVEWSVQKDYDRWQSVSQSVDRKSVSQSAHISQSAYSSVSQSVDRSVSQSANSIYIKKERKKENVGVTRGRAAAAAVSCDLRVDALEAMGLYPDQALSTVQRLPDFSEADLAACEAWLARSDATKPPSVLWSQYLSKGRIPAPPRSQQAGGSVAESPPLTIEDMRAKASARASQNGRQP